jgi:drug/metabolite transporter (DMT)-like permease
MNKTHGMMRRRTLAITRLACMVPAMPQSKPFWLILAPSIFLVLWSGGFAVAKLGVSHVEPITFLALRYVCVLALLAPLWLVLRPPLPRRPADWAHLALVATFIQVLYFGLCYLSFRQGTSAGVVAIIVCLQPILAGLIAPRFVGEQVGGLRWLGLVLGLAGAATVIAARSTLDGGNMLGLTFAFLGLLGMTAGTLWEKRFGVSHHPVTSNLVQYAVAAAITLPWAWATETMAVTWTMPLIAAMAYLVIGNSIISMSLLLAMIRAGEVSRVSSLFYLVPPLSALIAWPVLGESMPPLAWAGFALAAFGVAMASRKRA